MIEIQNSAQQVGEYGAWEFDKGKNSYYLIVPTQHGYVLVYAYAHPTDATKDMTVLRFICNGRVYVRHIFGKAYSRRFCVTLAKRFAQEVVDGR